MHREEEAAEPAPARAQPAQHPPEEKRAGEMERQADGMVARRPRGPGPPLEPLRGGLEGKIIRPGRREPDPAEGRRVAEYPIFGYLALVVPEPPAGEHGAQGEGAEEDERGGREQRPEGARRRRRGGGGGAGGGHGRGRGEFTPDSGAKIKPPPARFSEGKGGMGCPCRGPPEALKDFVKILHKNATNLLTKKCRSPIGCGCTLARPHPVVVNNW